MRIIDLTLEVRFKEPVQLVTDRRIDLLRKINPNEPLLQQKNVQGAQITIPENQSIISLDENRFGVSMQNKDINTIKRKIRSYVYTIYEYIDFEESKIARFGARTTWIHKCNSSFADLKDKYKDNFYKDNEILAVANDFAVNLTLSKDKYSVGYISGPVHKNEPVANVSFPVGDLNEANVYVSTDFFLIEPSKMTREEILQNAFSTIPLGEELVTKTIEVLGL